MDVKVQIGSDELDIAARTSLHISSGTADGLARFEKAKTRRLMDSGSLSGVD